MGKNNSKLIEKAIEIALQAHAGKVDKAFAPYILHPLRLMLQMQTEEEMMITVLHDVVEDGKEKGFTIDYLRKAGFPQVVIETVKTLTHIKETDTYEDYIAKIKLHPIARKIKMADLHDNMNLKRIPNPTKRDYERMEKYKKAIKILLSPLKCD